MQRRNLINGIKLKDMTERKTIGLKWDDMIRLHKEMKADRNRLHLLVIMQSFLGLRIADALTLTWNDFLSNAETLNLIEQKTKKSRKITINEQLRTIVKEAYEYQKFGVSKKEPIFLNKAKTSTISISYVNRQLKKAFLKYGIETSGNVSSHALRKTFAVKILEDNDHSDKGIFLVSNLLNHSSTATTMKYLNLDLRVQSEAYNSLTI